MNDKNRVPAPYIPTPEDVEEFNLVTAENDLMAVFEKFKSLAEIVYGKDTSLTFNLAIDKPQHETKIRKQFSFSVFQKGDRIANIQHFDLNTLFNMLKAMKGTHNETKN